MLLSKAVGSGLSYSCDNNNFFMGINYEHIPYGPFAWQMANPCTRTR